VAASTTVSVTVDSRVCGDGSSLTDHQLGELGGGHVARQHRGHRLTATDHGDLVRDLEHLVQMVADEQHRETLRRQLVDRPEEVAHLLRHQHRSWLVEDQDARAAVQHLEDLDPLPLTHTEVLDEGIRSHPEAVGLRDLADPAARGGEVQPDALARLAAEHHVLEHREVVGQHEVLVHHPDAGRDGLARRPEGDGSAVDLDRAFVRALHAVQDLHQRRLAGAVLTDERVHTASTHRDVDVAVGDDSREPFGDSREPDGDRTVAGTAR
jgi:hypothetical protein